MILVDTSIWIDHLRQGDDTLVALLAKGQALVHPFVTGELALGNLLHRYDVLDALQNLPQADVATENEALGFIEANGLPGTGIGYIDAHLLASVRLAPGTTLWTRDKRLRAACTRLGLSADLAH